MPLLQAAVNPDPVPLSNEGGALAIVDGTALMPEAGPEGTMVNVNADAVAQGHISVYTVHAGDTLSQIAEMFGVSINTIIWANDISHGIIHPGDQLIILPITGIQHTVAKGETLSSIAKKYKADAGDIAQYNGLDSSAPLAVGTTIIIPNGESSVPVYSTPSGASQGVPAEPYLGGSGPDLGNYFIWPVDGGVVTQRLHGWNAVDIGVPKGTGIYAAASGTVIVARDNGAWNGGYGNYVVIEHPNGVQTLYAHASEVLVSAGDSVKQGQTIALVGATGLATGPHLHFEVRGAKNPFALLPLGAHDPQ